MRGNFSSFIIEIVGAFIVWVFKGFKGTQYYGYENNKDNFAFKLSVTASLK